MADIVQNGRVVYIEPNATSSVNTTYETSSGIVKKSPDLEDFCIVVDLEVEVKGRTYCMSQNGANNTIKVETVDSSNGQTVRFMEGSKIYTNAEKTEYITSLTTNYTDCTLLDIEDGGTAEMFGIKSIDISYNNFMVPEVTIQFVDVRGVSLFAQEEIRHNLVSDGIANTANPNIEGSFFKCFFTFPYPKFNLKVKGFYGQMVSYQLTCSDFRAAFDSQTGNFNVTVKMIGYAFSFLNDVMANALLAAPYSEYIGAKYWSDNLCSNNDGKFYVRDNNGSKVDMLKLADMVKQFKKIQETVDERLKGNGFSNEARAHGVSEEVIKNVQEVDLAKPKAQYQALMHELLAYKTKTSRYFTVVNPDNTYSVCLIDDGKHQDDIEALSKNFETFKGELNKFVENQNVPALKNWISNPSNSFELKKCGAYGDISNTGHEIKPEYIEEDVLRKEVNKIAQHTAINDSGSDSVKYNYEVWEEWIDSKVYAYQDCDLKNILGEESQITTEKADEANKAREELVNVLTNEEFSKVFSFPPTVENITRIIMAHFETYAYMIGKCADNIMKSGVKRLIKNIGLSLDYFDDVQKDNINPDSITLPPFPSVTDNTTDKDGNTKREDAWLGLISNNQQDKFEEISLVEGLLNGITSAATSIQSAVRSGNVNENTVSKPNIVNPLSFIDLFIGESDNIFGTINMSNVNEIFAHICMRGLTVLGGQGRSVNAKECGELDAENFLHIYSKDKNINILRDCIKGGLTSDTLYKYFESGKTENAPDKNSKSNPWYLNKELIKLVPAKNTYCSSAIGILPPNEQGRLLPVKNWTFQEIKVNSFGGVNQTTKKAIYRLGNTNLSNYISTYLPNESSIDSLNVLQIKPKYLKVLTSLVDGLNNSEYGHSSISGIMKDAKPDLDNIKNLYLKTVTVQDGKEISYNSDGSINDTSFAISLKNVFTKKQIYNLNDALSKANYFLNVVFPDGTSDNNVNLLIKKLSESSTNILNIPKFLALRIGSKLWHTIEVKKENVTLRPIICNKFINYFKSWADSEFNKIRTSYELPFKSNYNFNTLSNALYGATTVPSIKKIINEQCSITDDFYISCEVVGKVSDIDTQSTGISVKYNICNTMSTLVSDLLQIITIASLTKFNSNDYQSLEGGPIVKVADLKTYLNGVINVLRNKLEASADVQEANTQSQTSSNKDPDDIKIGIYNYVKMLYDKWIASDTSISDYKMETMFEGENPVYHFIDSVYNNIGKSIFINLGTLMQMLEQSQTANGFTMLSMMSSLYASNKMTFLCLQNFANLSKPEMMGKMFTPIPYIEKDEPDNHPDFIVLYPYEASSKLAVDNAEYPDDTFYLNDSTTWPKMISDNSGPHSLLPAFGVSYGQQYQSYFKNIQVDMSTPMATEQSIKAKFLVCGGSTGDENNGPRHITMGQDLYTIYSNNSYTCTITMMGCAWIQPMMYFVLLNVPMFKGSYMIVKVNHQIEAGNMTTTFTGVRMARTATRAVKSYLYGQNNDSTNGGQGTGTNVSSENQTANIGNDCDYAHYDPNVSGEIANGTDFSSELSEKLIDNLPSKAINIRTYDNGYYKDWTLLDTLGAIAWQEFGGNSQEATNQRAAVVAAMYNWRGIYHQKNKNAYKNVILNSNGWPYFIHESWIGRLKNVAQNRQNWESGKNMVSQIFKNGPYAYLVGKPSQDGSIITLQQVQKTLHTALPGERQWGDIQYKLPSASGKYHIITGNRDYKNGFIPKQVATSGTTNESKLAIYGKCFANAVQSSLNATDTYKNIKVTYELGKEEKESIIVQMKAVGNNAMNAMFDCVLHTYQDNWDKLCWCVGTGNVNADAQSIIVKLIKSKPSSPSISVCSTYDIKNGVNINNVNITKDSDINKSLKLSLIKYFKKKSIKDSKKAQALFKSIVSMDDTTINKVFEFESNTTSSIESCNSAMGYTGGVKGTVDSGSWNTSNNKVVKSAIKMGEWYLGSAIKGKYNQSKSYPCPLTGNNKVRSDCSGFVSAVLMNMGKSSTTQNSTFYANEASLKSMGFESHKFTSYDELKAGDIVAKKGHVFIAAGDGKAFDFGNNRTHFPVNIWKQDYTTVWRLV